MQGEEEEVSSLFKAGWLQPQVTGGRWRGWLWFVCDESKLCYFHAAPLAGMGQLPDCIVCFFVGGEEVSDEVVQTTGGFVFEVRNTAPGAEPLVFRARTASEAQEWVHCLTTNVAVRAKSARPGWPFNLARAFLSISSA